MTLYEVVYLGALAGGFVFVEYLERRQFNQLKPLYEQIMKNCSRLKEWQQEFDVKADETEKGLESAVKNLNEAIKVL